jgi:carbon-monoxide dehydrogenase large subunit
MRESLMGKYVGARVNRVEDKRLLAGAGRYIDDVSVPGMLHAAFLRSPYPHAEIGSIDLTAAQALPGVHLILTGEDLKSRTYPFFGTLNFPRFYQPTFWALAVDRVRHVGDPVAIVVADSRRLAEDACELIEVDYEPLPGIATVEQALDADRAVVWPKSKTNLHYQASERFGDVDAAFAAAERVIVETFDQHRHSNQPMEARGIVAEVDPSSGEMTIHASTQSAHMVKWCIALLTGRRPLRRVVRQMISQRDHTKAIFKGMADYLKATPAMVAALKEMAPVMLKQNVTNVERTKAMNGAFVGLMGRDPKTLPAALAGDVGGAFGAKTAVHREDVAVCAAALELGRSVKWIEDRNEHLTVGSQAREESVDLAVAVRHDGTILGMRARLTIDSGAYPGFPYGGAVIAARLARTMFPGPYRLPALEFHSRIITSNKATYLPYRGPWEIETFVRERMLDVVARQLGLSRAEIRRRNLIGDDELPAAMVTGPALDVRMSARRVFEKAMDVTGADDWEKTRAEAFAAGRRIGMGFATYIEAAPGPPGYMDNVGPGFSAMVDREPINAVLEADGTVTLHTQQVTHGQSHETTLAQLAADQLGVPMEVIRISYGNTRTAPFGLVGTAGSRAATFASGAVLLATKGLRDRIVDLAADLLEAAPSDIVVEDGRIHVAGTPSVAVTLADVADAAREKGDGARGAARGDEAIRVSELFDGGAGGWSGATHVCFVEIDLDTGLVKIPRYVVVEDCGEIINPAVVDGQIRGGVAQGIGAVLYEKSTYDDQGQFQAGTFMDYLIPTAMEIPDIEIHHVETPSDVFANYRGVGEGGAIGAPAALCNAIEDALSDLGVRITEQHLPPARILELAGVIPTLSPSR